MKHLSKSLMILLAFVLWAAATPGHAGKFEEVPLLFTGTVTALDEVPAPTHDLHLADQENALAYQFTVKKAWKGTKAKSLTAYTTIEKKKPCNGVMPEKGKDYIIWGELDSTQKIILFNPCGGFMEEDGGLSLQMHKKLDAEFP